MLDLNEATDILVELTQLFDKDITDMSQLTGEIWDLVVRTREVINDAEEEFGPDEEDDPEEDDPSFHDY